MNLVPVEQALAAIITDRIIVRGSATPAQILVRSATALAYAGTLADIVAGNGAKAVQDLNGVLADPSMDPVLASELQALAGAAIQQVTIASSVSNLVPIFGAGVQAVLTNLGAGITSAANTLIAANQPPAGAPK